MTGGLLVVVNEADGGWTALKVGHSPMAKLNH